METVGITALVPPELIYACGMRPCDVNNFVPQSRIQPSAKLCSWTAIWREMILKGNISIDSLVVVAGGDCHNALVDGEKVALKGTPTFYFFYPFEEDVDYLENELDKLCKFLGGIKDPGKFKRIEDLKKRAQDMDMKRAQGKLPAKQVFDLMVSLSDLRGDITQFEKELDGMSEGDYIPSNRVALLGVPPINSDFHEVLEEYGLHVVYDELPYEFARLSGCDVRDLAKSYCGYTFARNIEHRLRFLRNELEKRKVDGIIHYTQFACHHLLEDDILSNNLDYPFLTIQGDLPGKTSRQAKLRLEAFSEMISKI
jgi:benzoyl-CoA reductase/2-hydroxyglutaryl-CoA dehydratase subunit BcrC/BadD/HgdB